MNPIQWNNGYRDRLDIHGRRLKPWWFCDTTKMVKRNNLHLALGKVVLLMLTIAGVLGLEAFLYHLIQ